MLKTPIGRLRLIGFLEGISFIVLLGIAMPLKYYANMPEIVKYTGWAHGLLFMLYLLSVVNVAVTYGWSLTKVFLAGVASVVPFGPFIFDARVLRAEVEAR